MPQLSMHSPIGDITISEEDGKIVSVDWGWARDQKPTPLLKDAKRQLDAYFDGALEKFDLPLRVEGTSFQKQVWREMCKIPAGQTRTYGDIAQRLKASAQSVGTACGRNRFPVIIPCHRVVAANGLGGYSGAGGVETKIALLELEKALMPL
jgi:methylated-DNA-[protein]-cysteine S-methyltransferase